LLRAVVIFAGRLALGRPSFTDAWRAASPRVPLCTPDISPARSFGTIGSVTARLRRHDRPWSLVTNEFGGLTS
jgi:hypothetical protein